jgi:DNA-binding MarR family transcriptional regulator
MSTDPKTLPTRRGEEPGDRPPYPPVLIDRVGFLLAQVKGGAESVCMDALAPLGLHVRQFGLLAVLATEGPRSQQELVEWTRVDRTSMVAVVDSLEERGLVHRERNPEDRRAYLLQITPEGRRLHARGRKLMLRAEDRLLGSLDESEREQFRALLTKVAVDIGRAPSNEGSRIGKPSADELERYATVRDQLEAPRRRTR